MPIVDINFRLNVPSVYCCKKLDFPTPESPGNTYNNCDTKNITILQSAGDSTKFIGKTQLESALGWIAQPATTEWGDKKPQTDTRAHPKKCLSGPLHRRLDGCGDTNWSTWWPAAQAVFKSESNEVR